MLAVASDARIPLSICHFCCPCVVLQPEPGSTRAELCELVQALLAQKAAMLQEYVGLTFAQHTALQQQQQRESPEQLRQDPQQQQWQPGLYLTGLPVLLEGYVPDFSRLPRLVLQLARDVEWETEMDCFRSLAAALADFHALQPLLRTAGAAGADAAGAGSEHGSSGSSRLGVGADGVAAVAAAGADGAREQAGGASAECDVQQGGQPQRMDVDSSSMRQEQRQQSVPPLQGAARVASGNSHGSSNSLMELAGHRSQVQREWLLRHVVMPAVKYMYCPPKTRARDGSVLLLTSMEKLYRVFERCGW
jgi:hypothetical protein